MSVVLIGGSPAFAQTAASATGTGTETGFTPGDDFGVGSHPHCLEVTDSSYSVDLSGTFSANNKTYTGDATLTWSTNVTYYVDEDGTYTTADHSSGCDLTTRGNPIDSSVGLSGGDTSHGISCSPSSGDYGRSGGMEITVHFSGNCTVYNGTGSTDSVSATFTGDLNPCDGSPGCPVSFIDEGVFGY